MTKSQIFFKITLLQVEDRRIEQGIDHALFDVRLAHPDELIHGDDPHQSGVLHHLVIFYVPGLLFKLPLLPRFTAALVVYRSSARGDLYFSITDSCTP